MCESTNERLFSIQKEGKYDGMIVPMDVYKRMVTAEILLRVLLSADIGKYGQENSIIDAARTVYEEETQKENGNAE